jgi:hypothetical protein
MTSLLAVDRALSSTWLKPSSPMPEAFDLLRYAWLIGPVITVVVIVLFVVPLMRRSAQRRQLLATGTRAQARIVSIQETGVRINEQPEVLFTLDVQPDGRPGFRAQCRATISVLMAPRVQPGMTTTVRYDPQDPTKVAIEF